MNPLQSILSRFKKNNDISYIEPEALDGAEERTEPLSTIFLTYNFCSFKQLKTATYIHLFAQELCVPEEIVKKNINTYLSGIKDDTVCCIEYPYIEEYYRDTYYSFYARKHSDYNRHCFRISFFTNDVTENNFFNIDLQEKFLGYVVLRPTPRRIMGYSFLSPALLQKSDISICICKRLISVMGRSLEVTGFPFMSHDGEALSCSENSILLVFDYFSRRYNNYARALASQIADYVSNNRYRSQPSIGLTADEAAQVFNYLGMTTRIYKRNDDKSSANTPSNDDFEFQSDIFEKLLRIFVESGIPIYVSTDSHAYLIIGRENKLFEQGAGFVVMDGIKQAYQIIHDLSDIRKFVVPIPDNILLDAHLVDPIKFYKNLETINSEVRMLRENVEYVHRIFLTTSRSFKKHIVETNMSVEDKTLIACATMPKFVWVSESILKTELNKSTKNISVEALGIYDATDYPTETNHLILAKSKDYLIIPNNDKTKLRRKKHNIFVCSYQLPIFQFNLKGAHTKWKG